MIVLVFTFIQFWVIFFALFQRPLKKPLPTSLYLSIICSLVSFFLTPFLLKHVRGFFLQTIVTWTTDPREPFGMVMAAALTLALVVLPVLLIINCFFIYILSNYRVRFSTDTLRKILFATIASHTAYLTALFSLNPF